MFGDRLFRPEYLQRSGSNDVAAGEQSQPVAIDEDTKSLLASPSIQAFLYYNLTQPTRREWDIQCLGGTTTNPEEHLPRTCSEATSTNQPHLRLANMLLPRADYRGIEFRVYHLLLLGILSWMAAAALRRTGLLPYHQVIEDIDAHLDSLDGKIKIDRKSAGWTAKLMDLSINSATNGRTIDRDVEDPRAVEQAMLATLRRMTRTRELRLPATELSGLLLPTPEVTFVFDELDKLRSPLAPEPAGTDAEVRSRTAAVHRLLAEMKNLLSSAPARFIFVGGRDLRDEWLADSTARNPLLTNIFNLEIYLPSLIHSMEMEKGKENDWKWNLAAKHYLQASYERSQGPRTGADQAPTYYDEVWPPNRAPKACWDKQWSTSPVPDLGVAGKGQENTALSDDLADFLTYRSAGNAKRLGELVQALAVPTTGTGGAAGEAVAHNLHLSPDDQYRIQLIASIYRHIAASFQPTSQATDDKLVGSIFHLSDFLLRFHGRAFSWTSLSRVEELADVHRAPDLRQTLQQLVHSWNGRYLLEVRNGLYDFRFRSDMATELAYLSRRSDQEMAAVNFTLDESRQLHAYLEATLKRLGDRVTVDLIAAQAELHEYDGNLEEARAHYRTAIALLDRQFLPFALQKDDALLGQTFAGKRPEPLANQVTWGLSRLRLMMLTGLCYEREANLERAELEYREARVLANQIFDSWRKDRRELLSHSFLLLLPLFAHAWLLEKSMGSVDTSIFMVDTEVKRLQADVTKDHVAGQDPNVNLLLAEAYNRAGDLAFYKGLGKAPRDSNPNNLTDGYLLHAHRYYAEAIHALRAFLHARRIHSKKWNVWAAKGKARKKTLDIHLFPEFPAAALGSYLCDMGEAMLGRVSLRKLYTDEKELVIPNPPPAGGDLTAWLENPSYPQNSLWSWFGTRGKESGIQPFPKNHTEAERLLVALQLGLWGAEKLNEAGARESAAREYLQVAEVAMQVWWWRRQNPAIYQEGVCSNAREVLIDLGKVWSDAGEACPEAGEVLIDTGEICPRVEEGLVDTKEVCSNEGEVCPDVGEVHNDEGKLCPKVEEVPADAGEVLSDVSEVHEDILQCTISDLAERAVNAAKLLFERARGGPDKPVMYQLVQKILGHARELPEASKANGDLNSILEKNPFPAAAQIHGRRMQADILLDGPIPEGAYTILEEAHKLARELNNPMLIGCAQLGLTMFQASQRYTGEKEKKFLRNTARHYLQQSVEMVTMGNAWYENIHNLYAPYDDFNDRRRHMQHALQLAAYDLCIAALQKLEEE